MYLEFEKKGLISKDEYEKIISQNVVDHVILQTNYYFETKDEYFKNNNSALRVRLTDEMCELTLKVRNNLSNIEYNHIIDDVTFFEMINDFKIPSIIFDYIDNDIKISNMIHFETSRSVVVFEGNAIEIDATDFGNIIDYEIEVEGENMNNASSIFNNFVTKNNVAFKASEPKIARYFKYNK